MEVRVAFLVSKLGCLRIEITISKSQIIVYMSCSMSGTTTYSMISVFYDQDIIRGLDVVKA